jgi:hypothetical protein
VSRERSLAEQVADVVVFAPLGLALEARRLLPEMASRGRRQLLFTRTVGKYAVKRGRERVERLVAAAVPGGPTTDGGPVAVTPRPTPAARPVPDIDPADLAIPDYDSLSAFQVMPRLEALDQEDLEAVRRYEEATRARRTILNKIAQLT